MAKVPFSKLNVKLNNKVEIVSWESYEIEVQQYLPMDEKAKLIGNVINWSADANTNFYNPLQIKVFLTLETLYAYTNISFTEKQKENILKLYDSVVSSGLFEAVKNVIPVAEWNELENTVNNTIDLVYKYRNSAMGVLDAISTDYSNLNLDASEIQAKLSDPENLTLLKDVITQLA